MEGRTGIQNADELVTRGTLPGSPRTRVLEAAVQVLAERGFKGTTVGLVTARARVSPRTFHELFDGLADCIGVILEQALRHVLGIVTTAFTRERSWQDGMRTALLGILDFLDAESALARVTMVEALAAGPAVLARRERVAGVFRGAVVERIEGEVPHAWPLAAEAMFASVMGVVHAQIVAGEQQPLVGLLAPLMATLIAPFSDEREIAQEVSRSQRRTRVAARTARPRWRSGPTCGLGRRPDPTPAGEPAFVPRARMPTLRSRAPRLQQPGGRERGRHPAHLTGLQLAHPSLRGGPAGQAVGRTGQAQLLAPHRARAAGSARAGSAANTQSQHAGRHR